MSPSEAGSSFREFDENQVLSFNTEEDLLLAIQNPDNVETRSIENLAIDIPEGFVGLLDDVSKTNLRFLSETEKQRVDNENSTFYNLKFFDELVPNKNFARLLNSEGKIEVAGKIYQITQFGTLYCDKEFSAELDACYRGLVADNLHLVKNDETDTYRLSDNVYLFDTFKGVNFEEEDEIEESDNFSSEKNGFSYETRSSGSIPWGSFPRHSMGAQTWVGKGVGALFGDNVYKTHDISKKRRVKAKLYDFNYRVYKEIGAIVKMRKKNWIGWSATKADELILSYSNMVLELDPPKNHMMQYNPWTNVLEPIKYDSPYYNGLKYVKLPGFDEKLVVAEILGMEMDQYQLQRALNFGVKNALKGLEYLHSNQFDADASKFKVNAMKITTPSGKIYLAIKDATLREENVAELNRVFSKQFSFYVSTQYLTQPTSLVGAAALAGKIFMEQQEFVALKLYSGDVRFAGRCGEWGGIIISR